MSATKQLHIITTGGTIQSSTGDGVVSISDSFDPLVAAQGVVSDISIISVSSPFAKLSENLSPADWLKLVSEIDGAYRMGKRRFVMTHGTDTMAYTAAALFACRQTFPEAVICLTGSFYPPDHPASDWKSNYESALTLCVNEEQEPGVFVAFRDNEQPNITNIIAASNLKPMGFDQTTFEASFGTIYARVQDSRHIEYADTKSNGVDFALPTLSTDDLVRMQNEIATASTEVCMVDIYPGIDFNKLTQYIQNFRVAVFSLYHSGTGPMFPSGFGKAKAMSTMCLFCVYPSRYVQDPYESTVEIVKSGGKVVRDAQPHQVFSFYVLGLALGLATEQMLSDLNTVTAA